MKFRTTPALILLIVLAGCATKPATLPAKAAAAVPDTTAPALNSQANYLALVQQMQQKSLWFASLAHLDALEQQWGISPASRQLRADALRQTGQAQASAALYQQQLGSAFGPEGEHGLGLLAGQQGDYATAIQHFEKALQQRPLNARWLNDLAYAQLRTGRLQLAEVSLMKAMQLQPEHTRLRSNMALLLMAKGQAEQAERWMSEQQMSEDAKQAVRQQARELQRST